MIYQLLALFCSFTFVIQGYIPGIERKELYVSHIKNKRIGLVVNHTSTTQKGHYVDFLLSNSIKIVKIFTPEHGIKGIVDAGELLSDSIDGKTNIPIVSLYGSTKKPTAEHLKDVDIVIFDIQDVGVRFYTYISTLHYVMEACAEHKKSLIVCDRPNPNCHYVAGPVLEQECRSFVGLHPIPIVYGLTIGELALLINGEGWLANGIKCSLQVIPLKDYKRSAPYDLPIKPSPNLPNAQAIAWYPSLCLFEGTPISVGRGTQTPFQIIGAPQSYYGNFTFTPKSIPGASLTPPHENTVCYGLDLRSVSPERFTLKYLIDFYEKTTDKNTFFTPFFDKLAGTKELKIQIRKGMKEKDIQASWEPKLTQYKKLRKKYMLYPE